MASVWKHPRSPYWTGIYADAAGRTRRYSTKHRKRGEALSAVQHLADLALQARERHLTRQAFDDECARMRERLYGERRITTARAFINQWLRGKTLAKAIGTSTRYASATTRFLDYLGPRADEPLRAIAPPDCQNFYHHLLSLRLAPATLVVELKTIRTVFNAARKQQLITCNPAEAVELPQHIRQGQVKRKTFTPEQVEIILREARDTEWYSAVMLGYYGGLRLGDAVGLKWEQVDFIGRKLTFRARKTSDDLVIPLHPRLEEHLSAKAGDQNGYICPKLANKPVGGRSGLSQEFLKLLRRAGLSAESVATKGQRQLATLSFHSLRKTFNTELHSAGVSQELRKKLTGHKSDSINDRYTDTKVELLRDAVKKLPRLAQLDGSQLDLL